VPQARLLRRPLYPAAPWALRIISPEPAVAPTAALYTCLRCHAAASSMTYRCATPGCCSALHWGCVTAGALQTPWRCAACAIGIMMPWDVLDCLLVCEVFAATGARATVSANFTLPATPAGVTATVIMACLQLTAPAGTPLRCAYPPRFGGVAINSRMLMPPVVAAGAAAPLVSVTSSCSPGANSAVVHLRADAGTGGEVADTYCVAIAVVRHAAVDDVIAAVLAERALDPRVGGLCLRAASELVQRPAGMWHGLRSVSIAEVAVFLDGAGGRPLDTLPAFNAAKYATSAVEVDAGGVIVPLRDALTRAPIALPARGDSCKHVACFDLRTYLEANAGPRPRWKCPLCSNVVFPHMLWVDVLQLAIADALRAGRRGGTLTSLLSSPGLATRTVGPLLLAPARLPGVHYADVKSTGPACPNYATSSGGGGTTATTAAAAAAAAAGTIPGFGVFSVPVQRPGLDGDLASLTVEVDGGGSDVVATGPFYIPAALQWRVQEDAGGGGGGGSGGAAGGSGSGVGGEEEEEEEEDEDEYKPLPRRSHLPLAIETDRAASLARRAAAEAEVIVVSSSDDDDSGSVVDLVSGGGTLSGHKRGRR